MHVHGNTKLGFFPLPIPEAKRLKNYLSFGSECSALDPCVGYGAAFAALIQSSPAKRYGIEIDAHRTAQAQALGIDVLQANTTDVRCPVESVSLLYATHPTTGNQATAETSGSNSSFLNILTAGSNRTAFSSLLFHKRGSSPALVSWPITSKICAFTGLLRPNVCASSKSRFWRPGESGQNGRDIGPARSTALSGRACHPRRTARLGDTAETSYPVPESGPAVFSNTGLPLDEVEDLLLRSSAYRQARRVLIHEQSNVRGRPLTPLHGGHVGLLCTAGLLNGVFGEDEKRHIAFWRSVKFVDHWEEEDGDATILHDRERFSHELTLIFSDGKTQVLTHEKAHEA